jgi:hypothetical protein
MTGSRMNAPSCAVSTFQNSVAFCVFLFAFLMTIDTEKFFPFYIDLFTNVITSFSETFTPMKTTKIHVISEAADNGEQPIDLSRLGRRSMLTGPQMYSVTVSSNQEEEPRHSPIPHLPNKRQSTSMLPQPEVHQQVYSAMEVNNAVWLYTKVAILFFTAMLVTWIPSSANRVYSVVYPGYISPPLQFASAFVLPLQGFWNAIIYITTSWNACRKFFGVNSFRSPHSQVNMQPISLWSAQSR